MSKTFSKTTYEAPRIEVLDILPEGLLCQSGDDGSYGEDGIVRPGTWNRGYYNY